MIPTPTPTLTLTSFDLAIAAHSADWSHECCICMSATTPDEAAVLQGCRHVFHIECLSQVRHLPPSATITLHAYTYS